MAVNNWVAPKNPVQQKFKAWDIADPKTLQKVKQNQPILREQTLGWWQPGGNFYYANNNKQWQQNALVGTWAMAPLPQQPQAPTLKQPQAPMSQWDGSFNTQPQNTGTTVVNNTKKSTGWAKWTNTQQQTPKEPEWFWENGVWYRDAADRADKTWGIEFWYWNYPKKEETPQQEQEQEQAPENRPEMDLPEREWGMLYWRATWDSSNPSWWIQTKVDMYSAEALAMEWRKANYSALQGMDSYDIAVSMASWTNPYWSQALRDLMQYDPQKYEEIQSYLKQVKGEESINSIAKNWVPNVQSQTEKATETVNNDINTWVNKNSTARDSSDVQSLLTDKLANSQVANSATQEMLNINSQIADIQAEIEDLPNKAKRVFKWDVPQYLVDAYVSNNSARLQSELSKLQARYNWAIDLYKTELSQKQWEAEIELKNRQFEADQNYRNWQMAFQNSQQQWNQYYQGKQLEFEWEKMNMQRKQLELSSIKTDSTGRPYVINSNWTFTYLTDDTYNQAVKQQVQNGVNSLMTVWQDWMQWWQCEAFTDSFNMSVYWQEMLPRDAQWNVIPGRKYTTAQEKASYVNTAIPVVGSTAVFNYWPNSNVSASAKKYWHTMVVTWYDQATGTITLKGSNKNWDEKVYTQTMNVNDFYSSKWGVGFRDPAQDMKLQAQSWAVQQTSPGSAMTWVFDKLIQNANTEGKLNTIATAEAMYNTLSELRDNGSLATLVTSGDLKKVLATINQKKFGADDGGTMFANQLKSAITKKNIDPQSQIALNKLYLMVEMKLRKESGAAISSSEWMSNFEMMLPQAYESKEVQMAKLSNWDEVIKRYARTGWMSYADYVPIFANWMMSTRQTR